MATGLFNLKQVNQAISQGAWSGYIAPKWVEYLVVAGGGSGGSNYGGGGGAGGLLTGIVTVSAGTSYTVTIGGGGAAKINNAGTGDNGSNSVFGSLVALGGGGGGKGNGTNGSSGGSGGGGGGYGGLIGGQGTANQGNKGGIGIADPNKIGAGGGGAGTAGLSGTTAGLAGNGGAGIASNISGVTTTYAGGGGGGGDGSGSAIAAGIGGVGGGGTGGLATYPSTADGTSGGGNTGGGGGGPSQGGTSGAGGSGIVVVRYPGSIQFFTGGTLSYANGYMIHTFYSSGTLAPTTPTPYVTSYQISRSLRFNSADSTYLNRTPASASNQKTWTFSAWVKRSSLTVAQNLMSQGDTYIDLNGSDQIEINLRTGGTNYLLGSTAVYRDVSAWYHVVVACDTTQANASDRLKLWVNNVQVTSYSYNSYTNIPQSQNTGFNAASAHRLGSSTLYGEYLGAYMTEVNFIDGQQLTPSSFGYTNPATGVWSPLAFVGTYGTNGFYLNFSDNSNTTAATLGKDYSGNGNNWTPNNFSVSAGAGNDSLVDSPTSYGTDTGVGGTVRGNYCTLNPLDNQLVLSNGNLQFNRSVASWVSSRATIGMTSGKWYWEVTATAATGTLYCMVGVSLNSCTLNDYFGVSSAGWGYSAHDGYKYNAGGLAYGSTWVVNDVIGIAFDADAGTITFYKNNVSQGTAYTGLTSGPYFPTVALNGTVTAYINFGQRPFAYTAPSGYKALCTQNLPTPTIGATTATQAGKYFGVTLRTGGAPSGGTYTTTVDMSNGALLWDKARNQAQNNYLVDSNRGLTKFLQSNATTAESTQASWYTSFGDGTYSTGSTDWGSGVSLVDWIWAAGANTTNTAGSITSTVSANTTSGFSVATFTTTTGSPQTWGHGLGVAPAMVITRWRDAVDDWYVYHKDLGATKYIKLNSTAAAITSSTLWNDTAPSSTVVTFGSGLASVHTMVAYCFAEVAGYSKFGSWTGNASTDGPFVFTGFRPAYVMWKRTDVANDWVIVDATRSTYNQTANVLYAEDSAAENTSGTGNSIDILSNGFKLRQANQGSNASGGTYIFMAFATSPFKYSLAR